MGLVLGLERLVAEGRRGPKYPGVLNDLRKIAQALLNEAGLEDDTIAEPDLQGFSVTTPDGTAKIYETHGVFPIDHMDPFTLKMIFEVAKAGDMVIMGDGIFILTDTAQPVPSWVNKITATVPVCHSADELGHLLTDWFGKFAQFRKMALQNVRSEPDTLPGARATDASVYIELRQGEANLKLFDRFIRFLRILMRERGSSPKEAGTLSTAWQLETPDGRTFVPWRLLRGDRDRTKELVYAFASREGRSTGEIINGDIFSSDDGRSFPLSNCKYAKQND